MARPDSDRLTSWLGRLTEIERRWVQSRMGARHRSGGEELLERVRRELLVEMVRLRRLSRPDAAARRTAARWLAGIDEAGRGPLAGPVVAAAVVLPRRYRLPGLDDSKRVPARRRGELFDQLLRDCPAHGVGIASVQDIEAQGIVQATFLAMRRALGQVQPSPDFLLVDGFALPGVDVRQLALPGGDRRSLSIAAASILAKVTRDRLMVGLDGLYPRYGFARHKGYGTPAHLEAIRELGPCPAHRPSFLTGLGRPPRSNSRSKRGREGEEAAARHLEAAGWELLGGSFRTRRGEVDLVARDGDCLVFVEVRTWGSEAFGPAVASVDRRKQGRLRSTAGVFLARHPRWADLDVRFDVVLVAPGPSGQLLVHRHLRAAF
ncbi:MAG TPA: ribonuclease HII [Bacillota bacterium]|nr:ribonuclease HII [Bacillota bacterium]